MTLNPFIPRLLIDKEKFKLTLYNSKDDTLLVAPNHYNFFDDFYDEDSQRHSGFFYYLAYSASQAFH